jgi:hypothetical protein
MLRLKRVRRSYLKGSRPDPTGDLGARADVKETSAKYIQNLRRIDNDGNRLAMLKTIVRLVKDGKEELEVVRSIMNAGFQADFAIIEREARYGRI